MVQTAWFNNNKKGHDCVVISVLSDHKSPSYVDHM